MTFGGKVNSKLARQLASEIEIWFGFRPMKLGVTAIASNEAPIMLLTVKK